MTPKEKALELYLKYYNRIEHTLSDEYWPRESHITKKCALIAIEFAREQFYKYCSAEMGTDGTYDDHFDVLRQEIEKLQ